MVGPLAVFGELSIEERGGDEVVAVLVGDAGKVVCSEFEFPFGREQPRIKASHKQPTNAKVKRCILRVRTKFFSRLDWSINIIRKH